MAMVEAWWTQGGAVSDERSDYIRRLGLDAKRIAQSVWGHWAIKNVLHWLLDLSSREDDSRIRNSHASENFAMLPHMG
jgi:predicted transposase YbfD/YdcC